MPKLTWNPSNEKERDAVEAAFDVYRKHGYVAKNRGRTMGCRPTALHPESLEARPVLITITFELPPTSFDHIMKESPWDT